MSSISDSSPNVTSGTRPHFRVREKDVGVKKKKKKQSLKCLLPLFHYFKRFGGQGEVISREESLPLMSNAVLA